MSKKDTSPPLLCVWCGSEQAFLDTIEQRVHCPVCGKDVDLLHRDAVPAMPLLTMRALGDVRYGKDATAALKRRPTTKMERKICALWTSPEYEGVLPVLLANRYNFPNGEMTARDAAVVRQVMIWLGSPVGQHFLYECGFTAVGEPE